MKSMLCLLQNQEKKEGGIAVPSALEALPTELKHRVASFLPAQDLLALAGTSKRMKSDLDITVESSTLTNPGSPNKGIMAFYDIKLVASVVSKQESDPFLVVFSCNVVPDRPTDGAVWIVDCGAGSTPIPK